MSARPGHTYFDFAQLNARDRYKLLIGTVIPRPIAFVTTVNEHGAVNAAPYSFFNCLSADPPIVAIGIENREGMRFKDTAHNVRMTGEFTVNIADTAMVDAMELCAIDFPPEVDELALAGLTAVPGTHVKCPRIGQAPAALECRRHMTLGIGAGSREILLGEVLGLFVRDGLVDPANKHVDQHGMDAIGRLGGYSYTRTQEQFERVTPKHAQWLQSQHDALAQVRAMSSSTIERSGK